MEDNLNYIGYLKYSGKLVDEGILDARKSAQALLGFDEAIRFFVNMQQPHLNSMQYEIPVRIKKGSWEALIPDTIGDWIQTASGVALTTYVTTMAKKLAENDFKEVGIKDIFKNAIFAIQWIIRIGKHIGNLTQKKFMNVKWRNNNKEIGLSNEKGEILFVPVAYYDAYIASRPNLLSKISEIIENERRLSVGIIRHNEVDEENINNNEKFIFYANEEDSNEILFPDLVHGQNVELEGSITRGNEISNSVGFKYHDHILTCYPAKGSIVIFKSSLFLKCKITGQINRLDKFGNPNEKKPRIIFEKIIPLEDEVNDLPLFDNKS